METIEKIHERYVDMYVKSVRRIEKTYSFDEAEYMFDRVREGLRRSMEGELYKKYHSFR